uniref:Uncharacterized protein n=1 Tax=Aegilops tauschii subsp. strangulata TaxID=200361 RepID=A0A453DZH8_AEGTS
MTLIYFFYFCRAIHQRITGSIFGSSYTTRHGRTSFARLINSCKISTKMANGWKIVVQTRSSDNTEPLGLPREVGWGSWPRDLPIPVSGCNEIGHADL